MNLNRPGVLLKGTQGTLHVSSEDLLNGCHGHGRGGCRGRSGIGGGLPQRIKVSTFRGILLVQHRVQQIVKGVVFEQGRTLKRGLTHGAGGGGILSCYPFVNATVAKGMPTLRDFGVGEDVGADGASEVLQEG